MTTLIYYTDNSLPPWMQNRCLSELVKAAQGRRIVTVSQKPLTVGDNICVGEIGRSYNSYYRQILAGAMEATTETVFTVEHDCLYHPAHFDFVPTDDLFYYNRNVWFADMAWRYSYHPRRAQSQMACRRELLIEAISEKLAMTETGYPSEGRAKFHCEPGVCDGRPEYVEAKTEWCKEQGRPYRLYQAGMFSSPVPNIDIRHGANLSQPASYDKAQKFADELPYWGTFKEYLYASA